MPIVSPVKPLRIIIDINDVASFEWKAAFALMQQNFEGSNMGFARDYGYAWYKVDPNTNVPIVPLSTNVKYYTVGRPPGSVSMFDNSDEIAKVREEIEAVERAVYRAKAAKEEIPTKTKEAMKKSVRTLYTRWASLNAETTEMLNTAEVVPRESHQIDERAAASIAAAKAKVARLSRQRNGEPMILAGSQQTQDMRDVMRAV